MLPAVSLFLSLLAQTPAPTEPAKHTGFDVTVGESKLKLYGYTRLDILYNDSRANDPQIIQWIKSEDETAALSANVARPDDPELNIHPKLARLGFDLATPPVTRLGNAKISGKIEVDFYNAAASESREALRMRHAYLKLAWGMGALTMGQLADLISPLFPAANPDFVMWNAGNLADRRPQLRAELTPKLGEDHRVYLQGMVGQTGANDNQSLDGGTGPSALDGVDAAIPTLQARLALGGKHFWLPTKTFELGLWAHNAKEALPEGAAQIAGEDEWQSTAVGLDLRLPLFDDLTLEAEAWSGENLDDVRGGIGQGVNNAMAGTEDDPNRGREIEATGGWGQLTVKASEVYSLSVGASLDDPEENLPAAGARDKNTVVYLANRVTPGGGLVLGGDFLNWKTEWTGGLKDGQANRVNLFAQYNF